MAPSLEAGRWVRGPLQEHRACIWDHRAASKFQSDPETGSISISMPKELLRIMCSGSLEPSIWHGIRHLVGGSLAGDLSVIWNHFQMNMKFWDTADFRVRYLVVHPGALGSQGIPDGLSDWQWTLEPGNLGSNPTSTTSWPCGLQQVLQTSYLLSFLTHMMKIIIISILLSDRGTR